ALFRQDKAALTKRYPDPRQLRGGPMRRVRLTGRIAGSFNPSPGRPHYSPRERTGTMRTILAAAVLIGGTWAAWADEAPVVAVPNRPDMPIVVYGCDAAYAVIESEWGLAKNVRIQPVVYGCRAPHPRAVGHYYP